MFIGIYKMDGFQIPKSFKWDIFTFTFSVHLNKAYFPHIFFLELISKNVYKKNSEIPKNRNNFINQSKWNFQRCNN